MDTLNGKNDKVGNAGDTLGDTLKNAKRVVLKIGSALLVDSQNSTENNTGEGSGDSPLRLRWLEALAKDISALKSQGKDVVVVSSGSIALGRAVLDLPDKATTEKPLSLDESQACAAVGQIRLAQAYEQALQPLNLKTAQVLLTLEDGITRRRYLNSRATMLRLLGYGVVPIVNENDTVATDEIRYGDNDRLAAQVAAMISADLLVLLSDVDGFYTANPRADNSAEHIARVGVITKEMESMATDSHNLSAKGGMRTKIIAAKTAMAAGCDMVIMKGDGLRPVQALQNGARHTLFCAADNPQQARKNWIAGMKTCGEIVIDDGARRAIGQGKSLLPAGVVRVDGSFSRGDVVAILDETGRALAKGLVCYDSAEVQVIAGHQTHKIKDLLGYNRRNVLVHRDDMIIL